MTNFEKITQDERTVAEWLSEIGCGMCPAWNYCEEHGEGKSCFGLILEWLKRDAETQEVKI